MGKAKFWPPGAPKPQNGFRWMCGRCMLSYLSGFFRSAKSQSTNLGGLFFGRPVTEENQNWKQNIQVVKEFWRRHCMSCSLRGFNDPFFGLALLRSVWPILLRRAITDDWMITFAVYTTASDFHCFSVGWPTLKNCPFPWGILTPFNTWFLGPMRLSTQGLHFDRISWIYRVYHRQTDHATLICSNRPHLASYCCNAAQKLNFLVFLLFLGPDLQKKNLRTKN